MSAPVWRVNDRPVSVREWREYCEAVGLRMPRQPRDWSDDHPVVNVRWYEAVACAEWLTARGRPSRLPTDAEWQAAATERDWRIVSDHTSPDVSVWEWTADAPQGSPACRVVRGGSWLNPSSLARAAYRDWDFPGARRDDVGVRLASSAPIHGGLAAPCPVCADNVALLRRAEADLAEALWVLTRVSGAVGAGGGVDIGLAGDVDALLARHRPPEAWRRGGGA